MSRCRAFQEKLASSLGHGTHFHTSATRQECTTPYIQRRYAQGVDGDIPWQFRRKQHVASLGSSRELLKVETLASDDEPRQRSQKSTLHASLQINTNRSRVTMASDSARTLSPGHNVT